MENIDRDSSGLTALKHIVFPHLCTLLRTEYLDTLLTHYQGYRRKESLYLLYVVLFEMQLNLYVHNSDQFLMFLFLGHRHHGSWSPRSVCCNSQI